ncbi:GNAT family N-acetyltransferase [Flavobacterium sp. DG2-3]|uniref:GNAT family N-acetyltransferase n=1 Tax=Flavobacterium sp. DG2-3 TaxID=3068317 RepID=UPI00273EA292|nr:GNAT family N-acetyltransferase [Flavobacterium sp. DG2-3]MDP5200289.1 N-acetyltransferase family protein [Flavobacterium sp. DG2-3]
MEIRKLSPQDWDQVKLIYQKGIDTGNATFQNSAPSWEEWDNLHLESCRIILQDDNIIIGWAALSPVSSRCVYAGVAEVSVYVDSSHSGKGIGLTLLNELVRQSEEEEGIWTLQAGIFPENKASLRIHQKAGFRILGIREKIGKQNGIWRNTAFLERRSSVII